MSIDTPAHRWIAGSRQRERRHLARRLAGERPVLVIDAHRRLRGPYTAVGSLMRALDRDVLATGMALLRRQCVAVLSVAPELGTFVGASEQTLTSLAAPSERTRFYSAARTLRISHGVIEVLRWYLEQLGDARPVLVFDNVDKADATDLEFLSVALRRLPATDVLLVLCGADPLPDTLSAALHRYAQPEAPQPPAAGNGHSTGDPEQYVAGDCVSDDPELVAAYEQLPAERRAALHDARAAELRTLGEPSLRLGAIPFHVMRGSDPEGGIPMLREVVDHLLNMGYYAATIELAECGRKLLDPSSRYWWFLTTKVTNSLAALGRAEEAVPHYEQIREVSADPEIHMGTAYAMAMLHTRHLPKERQNHHRAKQWANTAISIAQLLPDEKQRAFQTVFNRNGLALVEAHLGTAEGALNLVTEGIALLDSVLEPDEHALHRSVLRHNRAQVLGGMGRLPEALADFDAVIRLDPNYPEYYFDRGNLLRRMGRFAEALADYDKAIELSPPFPEVYYNRGDLLLELGETDKALADLDYVLELAPDFLDALINRAGLRYERGAPDGAWADVLAGLEIEPDNAHLLCVRGDLLADRDDVEDALRSYTDALSADPDLVAAWANRGALLYRAGHLQDSAHDLTEALTLGGGPDVRLNRGIVLQAMQQWDQAAGDFEQVLAETDEPEARSRLLDCQRRIPA